MIGDCYVTCAQNIFDVQLSFIWKFQPIEGYEANNVTMDTKNYMIIYSLCVLRVVISTELGSRIILGIAQMYFMKDCTSFAYIYAFH